MRQPTGYVAALRQNGLKGFRPTRAVLERAWFHNIPLATTEFRKADGSLTWLSLIFPDCSSPRPKGGEGTASG